MVLMQPDPFRQLERLTQRVLDTPGKRSNPTVMPMDAWRDEHYLYIEFDLPGLEASMIGLGVERNVLTVTAERPVLADNVEMLAQERPRGTFSRQVVLGDNLDTEHISATYDAGVLRLQIPVSDIAKPRKIEISSDGNTQQSITA